MYLRVGLMAIRHHRPPPTSTRASRGECPGPSPALRSRPAGGRRPRGPWGPDGRAVKAERARKIFFSRQAPIGGLLPLFSPSAAAFHFVPRP